MENDFKKLKEKKAKLERVSNELLNPQYTQSTSESKNNIIKSKSYKLLNNHASYEY